MIAAAAYRLGKCLSLASCSAFLGNLQGTDCAGRAWACLRSNTRDDCCRRLRGSGDGVIGFHGLTPTAKCGRRIRGLLEPPGWRPGTILFLSPLGKCLSLASCSAFLGNLQGTDCAGRAWALGSTPGMIAAALRGSGDGTALFHGLTPTAKCGRRIRGLARTPGLAPGDYLFKKSFPLQCCDFGEPREPRLAWLTRKRYRATL